MNIQSAINKEVFIPRDERMLVAVEVRRRKRKRVPFLPTGGRGDYATFICISVTNKKPPQLLITKVKRFTGSTSFTRRSQWTVEQLRQVNGINPKKDCPEFDLVFDNTLDEWVASSSAEKCIFVQILYHACQTYWEGKSGILGKAGTPGKSDTLGKSGGPGKSGRARRMTLDSHDIQAGPSDPLAPPAPRSRSLPDRRKSYVPPRQTEFVNCQSKLTGDACTMNLVIYRCKAFFNRMKTEMVASRGRPQSKGRPGQRLPGRTMGSVVQRANLALGERGEKLSRAEDKTVELMHKAQQFADTAHKVT
ncbi:syntaxin binding protein 6 (amisyn), like [Polymixia lowei]